MRAIPAGEKAGYNARLRQTTGRAPNLVEQDRPPAAPMLMKSDTAQTTSPLVWVLQTARKGDSAQARALAERLGWRCELKTLSFNTLFNVPNKLLGPSLVSLTAEAKRVLTPPWPDLVIGVARRTVPAARWIKARSGGHTKLVQIGRPRLDPSHFDLVITSPQYGLPPRSNVITLPVPLHPPIASPEADLAHWTEQLQALPRPWTAIILGGAPWPFRFDEAVIDDLAQKVNALTKGEGACIICGSPRTPANAPEAMAAQLDCPSFANNWSQEGRNPYHALLHLADRLIVSGDSASMLGEACSTGKPVYILDLPNRALSDTTASIGRVLARTGLINPPRNMRAIHAGLVDSGHALILGRAEAAETTRLPNTLGTAHTRVAELFSET